MSIPEFGSLQAWERRTNAASRSTNGDFNVNDPTKSSGGFYGGTPMPYVGETKVTIFTSHFLLLLPSKLRSWVWQVEVAFSGIDEKGDNVKSVNTSAPMKVLPPWMIREGMTLAKEQRGLAREESKLDGTLTAPEQADDKKPTTVIDEEKNIQVCLF